MLSGNIGESNEYGTTSHICMGQSPMFTGVFKATQTRGSCQEYPPVSWQHSAINAYTAAATSHRCQVFMKLSI